jgi:hypothetical protein
MIMIHYLCFYICFILTCALKAANLPRSPQHRLQSMLKHIPIALGVVPFIVNADDDIYRDDKNNFSLFVPPGFNKMPRKVPTARFVSHQVEESLFVATQFAEGAALSVTRSNARRLLYDFEIEWYFAPIEKIGDLGNPDLIAELLVLQRQGDFEKKQTPSTINNAKIQDDNTLVFDFETPLADLVSRKTLVKTFFDSASLSLTSVWVSALKPIFEQEYGQNLKEIRESFSRIS